MFFIESTKNMKTAIVQNLLLIILKGFHVFIKFCKKHLTIPGTPYLIIDK